MMALGGLIAVGGVAIDYLLPFASPGLNLPQILIIAGGLALSLLGWRLKRAPRRGRRDSRRKTAFKALLVAVVTLLVLEIGLTAAGIATTYTVVPPEPLVRLVDFLDCGEEGCHYVQDKIQEACARGEVAGRRCHVNRQGYSDEQDFTRPPADGDEAPRILMLGDSFTFGITADPGLSYVETLQARFPESVVWNTGMPGVGTQQAILAFREYAPALQPHLTVLGFYMNDYGDNIRRASASIVFFTPEGNLTGTRTSFYDGWGNAYDSSVDAALRYWNQTDRPPRNAIEQAIGLTRLGSLAMRLSDSIGIFSGALLRTQVARTGTLLADLRDVAAAQDSALLVIVIPRREDLGAPGDEYRATVQLLREAGIPYLEPIGLLEAAADYMPEPDPHWNNAGHQMVGALLSDCVDSWLAAGDFSGCAAVTLP